MTAERSQVSWIHDMLGSLRMFENSYLEGEWKPKFIEPHVIQEDIELEDDEFDGMNMKEDQVKFDDALDDPLN